MGKFIIKKLIVEIWPSNLRDILLYYSTKYIGTGKYINFISFGSPPAIVEQYKGWQFNLFSIFFLKLANCPLINQYNKFSIE